MNWAEPTFWTCAAVLLYVYLGYPGLMWIAGHLPHVARSNQATASLPTASLPPVSLIVPAHNEAEILESKLGNIREIAYPAERIETILVSDGSTDDTVEIARRNATPHMTVLDLERGGKAAAVNAAVLHARGEVLCLCDANVLFQPEALQRLVVCLEAPDIGAVSGDVRLISEESDFGAGESLFYRIERQIQRGETRVGSVMGVDGGMYVLRRRLFRPLPAGTVLDDFAISIDILRQGFRVVYESNAVAFENGTPSSVIEFRRRVRVSAGVIRSLRRSCWPPLSRPVECWQYVSHKLLRWFAPYLLGVLGLASLTLAGSTSFYSAVLAGEALFVLTAALATVSPRFRRTALGGVPFFFVLSNLATVVGHAKGLLDHQAVTWERTARSTHSARAEALDKTPACGGFL